MKSVLKFLIACCFIFCCNACDNKPASRSGFLNGFYEVSLHDLQRDLLIPDKVKNRSVKYVDDKKILSTYISVPVNEPDILGHKSWFKLLYQCRFKEGFYLVSYLEEYGSLTECKQYLCMYDSTTDRIVSKMIIYMPHGLSTITRPMLNGNEITVSNTRTNIVDGGVDTRNPYTFMKEVYSIRNNRFEKK